MTVPEYRAYQDILREMTMEHDYDAVYTAEKGMLRRVVDMTLGDSYELFQIACTFEDGGYAWTTVREEEVGDNHWTAWMLVEELPFEQAINWVNPSNV